MLIIIYVWKKNYAQSQFFTGPIDLQQALNNYPKLKDSTKISGKIMPFTRYFEYEVKNSNFGLKTHTHTHTTHGLRGDMEL